MNINQYTLFFDIFTWISRKFLLLKFSVLDTYSFLGHFDRLTLISYGRLRLSSVIGRWGCVLVWKRTILLKKRLGRYGLWIGIGCGGGRVGSSGGGDGGPGVVRFRRRRVVWREVGFPGNHAIVRGMLGLRVAVLGVVELFTHHVVQRAALKVQYLLERPTEVPIQRGIDYLPGKETWPING